MNLYIRHFFHAVDDLAWVESEEDVFRSVIWRWHYKPDIDNTPRGINPFCIECVQPKLLRHFQSKDGVGNIYIVLDCAIHQAQLHELGYWSDLTLRIRDRIKQKLKDGYWVEVVNKKRIARHQAPISPSQVAPHTPNSPDKTLDEMKTDILLAIAKLNGYCRDFELDEYFLFKVDRVTLDYHLHILEDPWEYISIIDSPLDPTGYRLEQKGRDYLIKNKLWPPKE